LARAAVLATLTAVQSDHLSDDVGLIQKAPFVANHSATSGLLVKLSGLLHMIDHDLHNDGSKSDVFESLFECTRSVQVGYADKNIGLTTGIISLKGNCAEQTSGGSRRNWAKNLAPIIPCNPRQQNKDLRVLKRELIGKCPEIFAESVGKKEYLFSDMLPKYEPCCDGLNRFFASGGEDEDVSESFEACFNKFLGLSGVRDWDGNKYDVVFYGVSGYSGSLLIRFLKRTAFKQIQRSSLSPLLVALCQRCPITATRTLPALSGRSRTSMEYKELYSFLLQCFTEADADCDGKIAANAVDVLIDTAPRRQTQAITARSVQRPSMRSST